METRQDHDAARAEGEGEDANGTATDATGAAVPGTPPAQVAIEARGLSKTFRIPAHRMTTLKERAVHPFTRSEMRTLTALQDASFDIAKGEFFGIVGRNGSGKSTLLKILASIYRTDSGTVRVAGSVAPFIELGVGFSMEFPARENVVLNGVMMGLTPKEARKRLGAVLEFAELEEFADLKLKNYSSGMLVRLAFSAMIQADADIMLIDEVLAVGDASFQQKCLDVFHDMRAAGKTVVLVTHDMNTVEEFCDRAMLIHDGEVRHIGAPEEVSRRYFRLNFGAGTEGPPRADFSRVEGDARVNDFWLTNGSGERVRNIEQRETIRLRAIVEARRPVERPGVGFLITNMDDIAVYGFGSPLQLTEESHGTLEPGEGLRVAATIENRLSPGRYYVTLLVCRNANMTDVVLRLPKALDFVVYGPDGGAGVVSLKSDLEAFPDDGSWD